MIDGDLWQAVANNLAGRPVILRWRPPSSEAALGCCYKTLGGQCVIDIQPNMAIETTLDTLLHEAAHARFDFDGLKPTERYKLAPGSLPNPPELRRAVAALYSDRESAADRQAAAWLRYAEQDGHKYYWSSDTTGEALLRALANWKG